jgi:hypothetical protein
MTCVFEAQDLGKRIDVPMLSRGNWGGATIFVTIRSFCSVGLEETMARDAQFGALDGFLHPGWPGANAAIL